ncbi:MAG: hypothetical protein PVF42_01510 [Desulfobacterales bacterium]|jgi:hypothetical protein
MNTKISIKTDNPALYGLLNSDLPYGVKIISDSPYKGRSLEISTANDIQIMADFSVIEKNDLVNWLVSRASVLKGTHEINVNRQQISVNNPEAIKFITSEIEKEQ